MLHLAIGEREKNCVLNKRAIATRGKDFYNLTGVRFPHTDRAKRNRRHYVPSALVRGFGLCISILDR